MTLAKEKLLFRESKFERLQYDLYFYFGGTIV